MNGIIHHVKTFFKVEHLGGKTPLEMVGNMCTDSFALYLLGYKDTEGKIIRVVQQEEFFKGDFAMTYFHYTPVPKGWQIPVKDRPFIPPNVLETLEKGIESCRRRMGERDPIN